MDRSVEYEILENNSRTFEARAIIDDRAFHFLAEYKLGLYNHHKIGPGGPYWVLTFSEEDEHDRYYDKTGKGGEMQVLSFVASMTKKFLEKYDPDVVRFAADKDENKKDNRASVYRKLAKKLFTEYDAFEGPKKYANGGDYVFSTDFAFVKKGLEV
jgi:hypothetical protein